MTLPHSHRPLSGYQLLRNPALNKSTAFTRAERDEFKMRGLLPYAVREESMQEEIVLESVRRKPRDIDRYSYLMGLQDRNERLFYRVIMNNIQEIMPYIYTPTVGQACKEFAQVFRTPRGFYINPEDKGHIRSMLDNVPFDEVKVIVVTDGQRILGLGDLGANGMGIPIGKLALYTACAGIHPRHCLPVLIDVGTNNEELLNDPRYLGYPHPRLEGPAYFELIDEFVHAARDKFGNVLIQFEDFHTNNAYALLEQYQSSLLCFNDDIQGTAGVVLAGIYASLRISKKKMNDLTIMFLGAGSASTGIGRLIISAFEEAGLTHEEAKKRLWFNDRSGLIVKSRSSIKSHVAEFAQDYPALSFEDAIKTLKPDILIGATGNPNTFNEDIIKLMCQNHAHPVIFALSNPTSRAECTAKEAYTWSNGQLIFASGSPFPAETINGVLHVPGQGNNAYIFPGVGLGAIACNAKQIPDEIFLSAAQALANLIQDSDLANGTLYPSLQHIRSISLTLAVAVIQKAQELGLAQTVIEDDIEAYVQSLMYSGQY